MLSSARFHDALLANISLHDVGIGKIMVDDAQLAKISFPDVEIGKITFDDAGLATITSHDARFARNLFHNVAVGKKTSMMLWHFHGSTLGVSTRRGGYPTPGVTGNKTWSFSKETGLSSWLASAAV